MGDKTNLDDYEIRSLSKTAMLNLARNREEIISSSLSPWINDANELCAKMSDKKYLEITPITVFSHC